MHSRGRAKIKANAPSSRRVRRASDTDQRSAATRQDMLILATGTRAAFVPTDRVLPGKRPVTKCSPRRTRSCAAALDCSADALTLQDLTDQLASVRAHYRRTNELDAETVRVNMFATRIDGLQLQRCHLALSEQPEAGTGLFASRDILEDELVTLYPGDALLYWPDGDRSPDSDMELVFGLHVPAEERDLARVTRADAREYEVRATRRASCVGDPRRRDESAYMGHFANDGATCTAPHRAEAYRAETTAAANAEHVTVMGCHLATVATRDIPRGTEVLVTYGVDYWLSRSDFEAGADADAAAPVRRRRVRHTQRRRGR